MRDEIKLYISVFFLNFLILFLIGFFCTLVIQVFNAILYWYISEFNPHPISVWLSVKYTFFPAFFYGLSGIYSQWDSIRQSKQPPRKRHPHD